MVGESNVIQIRTQLRRDLEVIEGMRPDIAERLRAYIDDLSEGTELYQVLSELHGALAASSIAHERSATAQQGVADELAKVGKVLGFVVTRLEKLEQRDTVAETLAKGITNPKVLMLLAVSVPLAVIGAYSMWVSTPWGSASTAREPVPVEAPVSNDGDAEHDSVAPMDSAEPAAHRPDAVWMVPEP